MNITPCIYYIKNKTRCDFFIKISTLILLTDYSVATNISIKQALLTLLITYQKSLSYKIKVVVTLRDHCIMLSSLITLNGDTHSTEVITKCVHPCNAQAVIQSQASFARFPTETKHQQNNI